MERLSHAGLAGMSWWQWAALPAAVLAAWTLGSLLSRLTRAAFLRLLRRTRFRWDDALVRRLGGL